MSALWWLYTAAVQGPSGRERKSDSDFLFCFVLQENFSSFKSDRRECLSQKADFERSAAQFQQLRFRSSLL